MFGDVPQGLSPDVQLGPIVLLWEPSLSNPAVTLQPDAHSRGPAFHHACRRWCRHQPSQTLGTSIPPRLPALVPPLTHADPLPLAALIRHLPCCPCRVPQQGRPQAEAEGVGRQDEGQPEVRECVGCGVDWTKHLPAGSLGLWVRALLPAAALAAAVAGCWLLSGAGPGPTPAADAFADSSYSLPEEATTPNSA